MKHNPWCLGLLAVILLCSCALQDDVYTLDRRLSALERRNSSLEKQNRELAKINRDLLAAKENIASRVEGLDQNRRDDEMALRGQYAGLAAQLESLRQDSQLLSGRLEEMAYLLNKKLKGYEENQLKNRERIDRLSLDAAALQKRIEEIDRYLNLEGGSAVTPAKPEKPAAPADKPSSDAQMYAKAKAELDNGKMEAARKGFQLLIKTYPKSRHADNAQFWIGESYYREKWYEKAILEYQKVIEKYPRGNKVPAALLKQGLSFDKIGETSNARLVLKELIAKHPSTNEASIAKKKLGAQ
jgi:tol-pal system protein YbgF